MKEITELKARDPKIRDLKSKLTFAVIEAKRMEGQPDQLGTFLPQIIAESLAL